MCNEWVSAPFLWPRGWLLRTRLEGKETSKGKRSGGKGEEFKIRDNPWTEIITVYPMTRGFVLIKRQF